MKNTITIAVDAMGGDDSPNKILKGIEYFNKNYNDVFYKIFGNKQIINQNLNSIKLNQNCN